MAKDSFANKKLKLNVKKLEINFYICTENEKSSKIFL